MIKHEELKGIVKTITDGLKDANMQVEWGERAKDGGNPELAMLHFHEAKKRLDGVKEWYDKAKGMHTESNFTPLEEMLMCHYKHWYHELLEKVGKFLS